MIIRIFELAPDVVSPTERLVLLALADHADNAGANAYPGNIRMARRTSLQRRSIQKTLRELERKGFIVPDGVMSRGAIRYRLNIEALDRARHSQSADGDRAPYSQSHADDCALETRSSSDCAPSSPKGRTTDAGRANVIRGGGEPRSPELSFNSPLTVNEQAGADTKANGKAKTHSHRNHAACDQTGARCVPFGVHVNLTDLLSPKYGGDREQAAKTLQDWYQTVWQSLPADFVMPDAFKFWGARFDATFASADGPKRQEPRFNVPGVEETRKYLERQKAMAC
jgi:hypothetical protein